MVSLPIVETNVKVEILLDSVLPTTVIVKDTQGNFGRVAVSYALYSSALRLVYYEKEDKKSLLRFSKYLFHFLNCKCHLYNVYIYNRLS